MGLTIISILRVPSSTTRLIASRFTHRLLVLNILQRETNGDVVGEVEMIVELISHTSIVNWYCTH